MSDHPEELLAEYVEGTLAEDERIDLDAHLSECARCREEVDLARHGLEASARLEDLEVPGEAAWRLRGLQSRGRWYERRGVWASAAAAAAAAGIIGAAVVFTGNGGGGEAAAPSQIEAEEAPAARPAEGPPPRLGDEYPYFVESGGAHDRESLTLLTRDLRPVAEAALAGEPPPAGEATAPQADAAADIDPATAALECVEAAAGEIPAAPLRIEAATFEDEPAFVVAFVEERGGRPDRILLWVVDRAGCSPLHVSFQRL